MNKILNHILLLSCLFLMSSCDRFLDIVPKGQVIPRTTYEYRALLNKGYNTFPQHRELLQMRGVQITPHIDPYGLSGFPAYRNIYTWQDATDTEGQTTEYPYQSFYTVIFYANSVIDGVEQSTEGSEADRLQLKGEALLLRAYAYFELTNMYGPRYSKEALSTKVVPINTVIDIEQVLPRATLGELYQLIEEDLAQAEQLLQVTRWQEAQYRYRASKEALYAIASRVYLYKGDYAKALEYAKKVLASSDYLEDLGAKEPTLPTLYQSNENIWALEDIFGLAVREYAFVSEDYYNSFQPTDHRKTLYFSSLTKYKCYGRRGTPIAHRGLYEE